MRHGYSVFIILAITFLVARSQTLLEVERAPDVISSLTSGEAVCPAPEKDIVEDDKEFPEDEFPEALAGVETEQLRRKRMARRKGCYWNGTAPFCAGRCKPGDVQIRRDKRGDGSYCWFGTKAYCCPPQEHKKPKSSPVTTTHTTTATSTKSATRTVTRTSVSTRLVKTTTPATTARPTPTSAHTTGAPISSPAPAVQVPLPIPSIPDTSRAQHPFRKQRNPHRLTPPQGQGWQGGGIPLASPAPLTPGPGGAPSTRNHSLPVGESEVGVHPEELVGKLSSQEHESDGKSFSEVVHDIVSKAKGITKLNFMGHFGEFAEPDDHEITGEVVDSHGDEELSQKS